jgi:hypothetical protein
MRRHLGRCLQPTDKYGGVQATCEVATAGHNRRRPLLLSGFLRDGEPERVERAVNDRPCRCCPVTCFIVGYNDVAGLTPVRASTMAWPRIV